ncbi:MAG: RluA family pseudouridine synthase [Ruminococcaceae bacterium]|nr:RluA family pseudouridine synthase [Oscillospiraceae bacterium]
MELKHIATRQGRLSSFLLGEMKLSYALMNKLKWGDSLRVNGLPQRTNYTVKPGDEICVLMDEPEPDYPAEQGHLEILYEDEYILAVDKPAGMLIHPSRSRNTGTLANFVAGYYQKTGQNSAFHPLTRLDRDTFGVVLLAKNAHVHTLLQQTTVQKTYFALTWGVPKENAGVIDAPIARRPLPSLLREIRADGKPSVTEYRVLEQQGHICKLALRPVTGRTHQLRLHCAYMDFPILGDPQYGTEESIQISRELGYSYQQLCAGELELSHPMTGEHIMLQSRLEVTISKKKADS